MPKKALNALSKAVQRDPAGRSGLRTCFPPVITLPEPLSRGGKPVCWVRMRPRVGWADALSSFTGAVVFIATLVEFLRRALW